MQTIKDNLNEMDCAIIQHMLQEEQARTKAKQSNIHQKVVDSRMEVLLTKTGSTKEAAGVHRKLARTRRRSMQDNLSANRRAHIKD